MVWVRLALEADGEPIVDGSAMSEFNDTVDEAVRRYQARHGLEVDGLVGPDTWFTMYPEFQTPTTSLAQYDTDASGSIEPHEVRAIGDANAPCENTAATTCAPGAP